MHGQAEFEEDVFLAMNVMIVKLLQGQRTVMMIIVMCSAIKIPHPPPKAEAKIFGHFNSS